MKIKTKTRAGGLASIPVNTAGIVLNHNPRKRKLVVKSKVRAGGVDFNHNPRKRV